MVAHLSKEAQVVMLVHMSKEAQVVMVFHLRKEMALCLHKVGQLQEVMFRLVTRQINQDHLLFQELLLSKGDKE